MRVHAAFISLILLLVGLIYAQTRDFEYVNYDDPHYVYYNHNLVGGLTVENVWWAFTTDYDHNWMPLTWITFLIDVTLFDLAPGALHIVNVGWHAVNALLLYWVIFLFSKRMYLGAFMAILFAIHPMHVESVAWITERKDTVSSFFGLASLIAYHRYVTHGKRSAYAGTLALFACSLMSKPMLVTLPILLLILDYYPLDRWGARENWKRIALEKAPFFLLSLIVGIITIMLQAGGGAVRDTAEFSLIERISNALNSYVLYLTKFFYPGAMYPFYPHPEAALPIWKTGIAVVVLLLITAGCWAARRVQPALLVGWLLFVIMMMPVIGIIQVGDQSMADRYTYLPYTGLMIMLAALSAWLLSTVPKLKYPLTLIAVVWLGGLTALAHAQTARWKDSVSLFEHTLQHSPRNYIGHLNLSSAYMRQTDYASALTILEDSVTLFPDDVNIMHNLGLAQLMTNDFNAAASSFQKCVELDPDSASDKAHLGEAYLFMKDYDRALNTMLSTMEDHPDSVLNTRNLGRTYRELDRLQESEDMLRQALSLNSMDADTLNELAETLIKMSRTKEAIEYLQRAVRVNPTHTAAQNNLGNALFATQDLKSAVQQLKNALQMDPSRADTWGNLGAAFLMQRDARSAVMPLEKSLELDPENAVTQTNYAVALLQTGDKARAKEHVTKAVELDPGYQPAQGLLNHIESLR